MSNSRDINYSTRPTKGAERKMLVELAAKLSAFHPLRNYQYVGYGGAYFCDFSLFHRVLDIRDMISIESDGKNRKRYEFNQPFDCIRLEFGEAHIILPGLDWLKPAIVWMDEIVEPSDTLFETVRAVAACLKSGSLILVTFRESRLDLQGAARLEQVRKRFGRYFIDCAESEVCGPKLQQTVSKMFREAITDRLNAANKGLPECEHRKYEQLVNIAYSDVARMTTLGGIVFTPTHQEAMNRASFADLTFVVREDTLDVPYDLKVPNLSLKEVRTLCEMLPNQRDAERLGSLGLTSSDMVDFSNNYRYYMSLGEIITA